MIVNGRNSIASLAIAWRLPVQLTLLTRHRNPRRGHVVVLRRSSIHIVDSSTSCRGPSPAHPAAASSSTTAAPGDNLQITLCRGPHQRAPGRRPPPHPLLAALGRCGAHVHSRPALVPPLEVHTLPACYSAPAPAPRRRRQGPLDVVDADQLHEPLPAPPRSRRAGA
jgi:hypothetical protein